MKAIKHPLFLLLLVWLAGFPAGPAGQQVPHGNVFSGYLSGSFKAKERSFTGKGKTISGESRFTSHAAYVLSRTSSSHTGHEEKRHKKTLVSEAIVINLPDLQPEFTYHDRKYSLFLPGGCQQQFLGKSYLRGPPSLS